MITTMESDSAEETFDWAKKIGAKLTSDTTIALYGQMGCGKTLIAQGIAAGLGVCEVVTSPTFVIVEEYLSGRLPLFHCDAYRIANPDEMAELGFEEYWQRGGVVLIEWAEQIAKWLPPNHEKIEITKDLTKGPFYRTVKYETNRH